MKIINVVGARPNFIKVASLHRAFMEIREIESKIVHTGQHYDEKMSDIFFNQLKLPEPDYYLGVGSGTHAEVTAKIMMAFEKVLLKENPDYLVVVGDVNSTIACALVAAKMNIKIVHVEAGLRSGDRSMPEEINRILTDSISDYLFVSEQSGVDNLIKEGIDKSKIHFVGNVMIDSLFHYMKDIESQNTLTSYQLKEEDFIVVTMHRPANVDNKESLQSILKILKEVSSRKQVLFPMHPRTKTNMQEYGLYNDISNAEKITILPPLGYIEFLSLVRYSAAIITDSGGIQEETTYMGKPCITLRDTTERPSTIELGTNQLIKNLDLNDTIAAIDSVLKKPKKFKIPPLWDGQAAARISSILSEQNLV